MISIVGTWRLVRAEAFDANGNPQPAPYGGAPIGRAMFTSSGRMMAMTGDGRREVHSGQIREYNTYAGTYTFDGKRLITRVDSCSNPAYMGTEQVREVATSAGSWCCGHQCAPTWAAYPSSASSTGRGFRMSTDDDTYSATEYRYNAETILTTAPMQRGLHRGSAYRIGHLTDGEGLAGGGSSISSTGRSARARRRPPQRERFISQSVRAMIESPQARARLLWVGKDEYNRARSSAIRRDAGV